jgi:hypothetical protein
MADGYTYSVQFDGYATDALGNALANNSASFNFEIPASENYENLFTDTVTVDTSDIIVTNQGGVQIRYYMRAYNTVTMEYVYWSTTSGPDFAAADSGYNPAILQDIVEIGRTL